MGGFERREIKSRENLEKKGTYRYDEGANH